MHRLSLLSTLRRLCCPLLILFAGLLLPAALQAQTAWVDSVRLGTETRFLFGNVVRRYDLTTRAWLTPVTLPRSGATAMSWEIAGCLRTLWMPHIPSLARINTCARVRMR